MLHALIWFVVLFLLAVWTLGAWASSTLIAWAATHAGTVSVATVGTPELPGWLAPWFPPALIEQAQAWLVAAAPAIDSVLSHAPAAADWISVTVWVVWALGGIVLLLLGGVLSGLLRWARRSGDGAAPPPVRPAAS